MRTYLCLDTGYCVTQCAALAEGGKNRVLYFTPWATRAGKYAEYSIGKYYPNIEKIYDFEKYLDEGLKEGNCIVNFAVENNGLIGWLRDHYPKSSIVGSGWGQVLEDNRIKLKKCIEALGLPQNHYEIIYGVDNLRKYLKEHKEIYVKINRFRGDLESFHSKNYELVKCKIDKLQTVLGPHGEDDTPETGFPFICEDKIETDIEIGFDGFFNGTDYVEPCFWGIEYEKGPYAGIACMFDELPEPLQETMTAFIPILQRFKYRGPISTEERIVSLKEHYLIDVCSRLPSPLSLLYPKVIKNYADAIYQIGKGEDVEFDIPYKYVTAYPFKDMEARDGYVPIEIKKGGEDKVSALMCCGDVEHDLWAVQGLEEIGCAIAYGDDLNKVFGDLVKNSEYIDTPDIEKTGVNHIEDEFKKIIKEMKEVGIDF